MSEVLSFYFGTGTRRHIAKKREGDYVWLWCGMSGFIPKVLPVRVEPSCRHCLRAASSPPASRPKETR